MSEKLSGRIVVANQCNSELIRLDIATEVSERFDCEFIRQLETDFPVIVFSVIIICISDRILLSTLNLCMTTLKIKINDTICGLRSPEVC